MRRTFQLLTNSIKMASNFPKSKPNSEWRTLLSPSQYAILREKATERPYTDPTLSSASTTTPSVGTYHCAACDTPLYNSSTKFNSGCGWPSFYQALPGALVLYEDHSHGMERIEMCCAGCDGHLGHIFKGEGYGNPVDERHCVNSISLKFVEEPVPVSKKL